MESESEDEIEYVDEEEDRPAPSSVRKYDIEEYSVVSENTQGNQEKLGNNQKVQKLSAVACAKCGDCFYLEKKAPIIKCENCGGRILFKVRTSNPIYYNSD